MQTDAPLLCYLSLPKKLKNGQFDALGNEVPKGKGKEKEVRIVLHKLPGAPNPWQCWGVVDRPLDPGQTAQVIFFNAAGSAVPGGAFTEWNGKTAEPAIGHGLVSLQSVSRAVDRARIIGRNDTGKRIRAAAGLLFVPPMEETSKKTKTSTSRRSSRSKASASSKKAAGKSSTAKKTTAKKTAAKAGNASADQGKES